MHTLALRTPASVCPQVHSRTMCNASVQIHQHFSLRQSSKRGSQILAYVLPGTHTLQNKSVLCACLAYFYFCICMCTLLRHYHYHNKTGSGALNFFLGRRVTAGVRVSVKIDLLLFLILSLGTTKEKLKKTFLLF